MSKLNFVQEVSHLKKAKEGNLSCAGSKRFTWSAPIVSPRSNERTDFENVAKGAPKLAATTTLAPATTDLPAVRGMIAEARAAKKRKMK